MPRLPPPPPDYEAIERRRDEVERMTRGGAITAVIAERLGVTERTVQRDRQARGISQPTYWMTDGEIARAAALLDDGGSYSEVARTLGRSSMAIVNRFPGRGYTKSQAAEARWLGRQLAQL